MQAGHVRDVDRLQGLIAEFGRMRRLEGCTPQSRGQRFNGVVAEMLHCWGIEAQSSVLGAGEIDVVFGFGGNRYIVEAKWTKNPADFGFVAKLQRRVSQRLGGTLGIFLSMSGYSPDALREVKDGHRLEVLLLDRQHFEAMLAGFVPPGEMLALLHDRASFYGDPYTPLAKLLRPSGPLPKVRFGGSPEEGFRNKTPFPASSGQVLLKLDSTQMGVAHVGPGQMLATTDQGIVNVNCARQTVTYTVPVVGCHRHPLIEADGAVVFTRHHGVAKIHNGELLVLGGGNPGRGCLLRHPDGTLWLFSAGEVDTHSEPSVTRLGEELGSQVRTALPFPAPTALGAAWLTPTELAIVDESTLTITSLDRGGQRRIPIDGGNTTAATLIREGLLLTISSDGVVRKIDITTGTCYGRAQCGHRSSRHEIVMGPDKFALVASDDEDGNSSMGITILQVPIPDGQVPYSPSVSQPPALVGKPTLPTTVESIPPLSRSPLETVTPASVQSKQGTTWVPPGGGAADSALPNTPMSSEYAPTARSHGAANVQVKGRQNPDNSWIRFEAKEKSGNWVGVGLGSAITVILLPVIFASDLSIGSKLLVVCVATLSALVALGAFLTARILADLEIGARGIQLFDRKGATWIPWNDIDKVDVVRAQGSLHLVVWTPIAKNFPGYSGTKRFPQYVPKLDALAICKLSNLQASKHQIEHAIAKYRTSSI